MLGADCDRLEKKSGRRVYEKNRIKRLEEVFFRLAGCEGLGKLGESYAKKLLYDLIAHDSLFGGNRVVYELGSDAGFLWAMLIKLVDEHICVKKESSAHSFLPG